MGAPGPGLPRRFVRLTALNTASNLTVPLAGLADTVMLGRLDDVRFLAGVILAALIFDYLYFGCAFLRMSTTGLTAQAWGREDAGEVSAHLYRALLLAAALGLAAVALRDPLGDAGFGLLSGPAGVEEAGRRYYDARIWGAPAAFANLALVGWFLGRGEAAKALLLVVLANLGNIALNWWFIVHLGWAAFGAGLATAAYAGVAGLLLADVLSREFLGEAIWGAQKIAVFGAIIAGFLGLVLSTASNSHLRPQFADGWFPRAWSPGVRRRFARMIATPSPTIRCAFGCPLSSTRRSPPTMLIRRA